MLPEDFALPPSPPRAFALLRAASRAVPSLLRRRSSLPLSTMSPPVLASLRVFVALADGQQQGLRPFSSFAAARDEGNWIDQRADAGDWLALLLQRGVFAPEARLFAAAAASACDGEQQQSVSVMQPVTAAEARRAPAEHLAALEVRERARGDKASKKSPLLLAASACWSVSSSADEYNACRR